MEMVGIRVTLSPERVTGFRFERPLREGRSGRGATCPRVIAEPSGHSRIIAAAMRRIHAGSVDASCAIARQRIDEGHHLWLLV